ncbi:AraC family transcriptional regulator [Coprococcus eutactus]|uniref:AraC family transcriptional regulator n=1 Tax=Coprococcus eutactus TaxID=33043 RepID=A0A412IUA6_9FIRM|nr:AraC family transcriptional regulator [Coprococcus eutactus]
MRHVHRIFSENIGKGPKKFSKIVRIRKTTERIFEDPYESITNYMEEMAYSDQAHFQREFKWYTGYTPGNFIRLNRSVKSSM